MLHVMVFVLLLAFSCGGGGSGASTPAGGKIRDGSAAELRSTLESLRGEPVVVNYWATWCGPCKQEMPRIVAAAAKYGEKVHFVGVNVEDDAELAGDFVDTYEMPFESIAVPNRNDLRKERIFGLPVTDFYDSGGDLAYRNNGEISTNELEEKIESLIDAS